MLAHDIRGALNGVIGGIAMMDRRRLDPSLHLQVERISAAAEALASLLEDATGAGGLAAGMPADGAGAADLDALLGYAERRWSGEAEARGLALRVERAPGLPERLLAEPVALYRILGNLLSNAVKFGEAGTVTLLVRPSGEGGIEFVVRDEGPGLSGADPARLFEFGYRSPGASLPGEGIGLHIVKELTDRIGGRIALVERREGGVDATLALPARLCAGAAAAAGRDSDMPDLSGRRILLAEDNPTNQMVASQMLAAMHADVTVADDGLDALAHFEKERFDIIVIDIEMPRLSGLDVIRAIRARSDRRARTPIVALTAYSMKEHRLRIAEAGADGLISKPILSTAAFGQSIAQHLRDPAPAADEPSPEDEPVIDMGVFGSLADTIGRDLMAELLDRIVADLDASRVALEAAADRLDAASIRTNSHILISVAGAFGASRLRCRAGLLNAVAHSGSGPELADGLRACLAEIPAAVAFAQEQRARC